MRELTCAFQIGNRHMFGATGAPEPGSTAAAATTAELGFVYSVPVVRHCESWLQQCAEYARDRGLGSIAGTAFGQGMLKVRARCTTRFVWCALQGGSGSGTALVVPGTIVHFRAKYLPKSKTRKNNGTPVIPHEIYSLMAAMRSRNPSQGPRISALRRRSSLRPCQCQSPPASRRGRRRGRRIFQERSAAEAARKKASSASNASDGAVKVRPEVHGLSKDVCTNTLANPHHRMLLLKQQQSACILDCSIRNESMYIHKVAAISRVLHARLPGHRVAMMRASGARKHRLIMHRPAIIFDG